MLAAARAERGEETVRKITWEQEANAIAILQQLSFSKM